MSISIVLVPLAIALAVTLTDGSLKKVKTRAQLPDKQEHLQTKFMDAGLLVKTLSEHGFQVHMLSDDHIIVKAGESELVYERGGPSEAFSVVASGWRDSNELVFDLNCLEGEYNSNVQSYAYDKLIENLSGSGMTVESEVLLEDNSILLTINI